MKMSVGVLDHYNVSTRKLDETVHFYENVLGFTNGPRISASITLMDFARSISSVRYRLRQNQADAQYFFFEDEPADVLRRTC